MKDIIKNFEHMRALAHVLSNMSRVRNVFQSVPQGGNRLTAFCRQVRTSDGEAQVDMYLPRPNSEWTDRELELTTFVAVHEVGHTVEDSVLGVDMYDWHGRLRRGLRGTVDNLMDDFRQEMWTTRHLRRIGEEKIGREVFKGRLRFAMLENEMAKDATSTGDPRRSWFACLHAWKYSALLTVNEGFEHVVERACRHPDFSWEMMEKFKGLTEALMSLRTFAEVQALTDQLMLILEDSLPPEDEPGECDEGEDGESEGEGEPTVPTEGEGDSEGESESEGAEDDGTLTDDDLDDMLKGDSPNEHSEYQEDDESDTDAEEYTSGTEVSIDMDDLEGGGGKVASYSVYDNYSSDEILEVKVR